MTQFLIHSFIHGHPGGPGHFPGVRLSHLIHHNRWCFSPPHICPVCLCATSMLSPRAGHVEARRGHYSSVLTARPRRSLRDQVLTLHPPHTNMITHVLLRNPQHLPRACGQSPDSTCTELSQCGHTTAELGTVGLTSLKSLTEALPEADPSLCTSTGSSIFPLWLCWPPSPGLRTPPVLWGPRRGGLCRCSPSPLFPPTAQCTSHLGLYALQTLAPVPPQPSTGLVTNSKHSNMLNE